MRSYSITQPIPQLCHQPGVRSKWDKRGVQRALQPLDRIRLWPLVENTLLRKTRGEVNLPTEEVKNEYEEDEREWSRFDEQTNRHSLLLSQPLTAMAFATLPLRNVRTLGAFFLFLQTPVLGLSADMFDDLRSGHPRPYPSLFGGDGHARDTRIQHILKGFYARHERPHVVGVIKGLHVQVIGGQHPTTATDNKQWQLEVEAKLLKAVPIYISLSNCYFSSPLFKAGT